MISIVVGKFQRNWGNYGSQNWSMATAGSQAPHNDQGPDHTQSNWCLDRRACELTSVTAVWDTVEMSLQDCIHLKGLL